MPRALLGQNMPSVKVYLSNSYRNRIPCKSITYPWVGGNEKRVVLLCAAASGWKTSLNKTFTCLWSRFVSYLRKAPLTTSFPSLGWGQFPKVLRYLALTPLVLLMRLTPSAPNVLDVPKIQFIVNYFWSPHSHR